jgi:hypothetical protein
MAIKLLTKFIPFSGETSQEWQDGKSFSQRFQHGD